MGQIYTTDFIFGSQIWRTQQHIPKSWDSLKWKYIHTKPFCWAQNPQLFHYLPYSNVFTSPGLLFTSPRVSIGQRISVGAWATFTYVYWSTSEAVFYLMNMEKPLKYLKCWKMLQVFAKQSVLGTPLHTSDMPLRVLTNPNPAHSSIVTGLAAT